MVRKIFKSRKGLAPTTTIIITLAVFIFVILIIYGLTYVPIPQLKPLRSIIHYVLIIVVFFLIQIGFVLLYYYVGKYLVKGFRLYRNTINNTLFDIKNYLITKGR